MAFHRLQKEIRLRDTFAVTHELLGRLYAKFKDVPDARQQIKAILETHRAEKKEGKTTPIKLGSQFELFAYVYFYFGSRLALIDDLEMGKLNIFDDATRKPVVWGIGAGAAPDLLVLAEYAEFWRRPCKYVHMDLNVAWKDVVEEVERMVNRSGSQLVDVQFKPLDICDVATWTEAPEISVVDIFTFIYCLKGTPCEQKWKFVERIFQSAKPGALFFLLDSSSRGVEDEVASQWDKLASANGLEHISQGTAQDITPKYNYSEHLALYREAFGKDIDFRSSPVWRISQKKLITAVQG
jgi:hypothetical protein